MRGGKFGKSRLVPHGPRIGELLGRQLERAAQLGRRDATAVQLRRPRRCLIRHRQPGLPPARHGARRSRSRRGLAATAACLRHSFAVGCLLRWYREGSTRRQRLFRLSTFMGHVDPTSTAVYLTITPALLEEANRRFEAFAAPAWTEATR